MCWVALDRAIALADRLGAADRVGAWTRTQDEIREAILTRGWSERAGAFTQSFGSDDLDASNLMMPIVGFLPADDPRVLATIDATDERLTDERGLVYRYRAHDGLGGRGRHVPAVHLLAGPGAGAGRASRTGRVPSFERARRLRQRRRPARRGGRPGSGELLGNFPQAFSHIGLVNAAWAIAQAQHRAPAAAPTGPESRG